jgi:hypothetical protein
MLTHEIGSHVSWKRWPSRVWCLALLVVFAARPATALVSTSVVSPTAGNATASGTTLRNALSAISSPSSTNPWLVKVEPGIYDIGTTALPMRSWVDIEGSGIGVTIIRGTVDVTASPSGGTVNGASDAELRLLTVEAIGTSTIPHVAAVLNDSAFPRLYRVKAVAQGTTGSLVYGIRNLSSGPRIEECEISATSTGSGSIAYGVAYKNSFSGSRSVILRSQISASAASTTYGISMLDRLTLSELRDSAIGVANASTNYGIYAAQNTAWSGQEALNIRNTEVSAAGGSSSYGVHFTSTSWAYVDIAVSRIWGHVASTNNYGIYHYGGGAAIVQGSNIVGSTATVEVSGNAMITSTELNGGASSAGGWMGCAGVWDESVTFYNNTCP